MAKDIDNRITAREIVQYFAEAQPDGQNQPMPEKVMEKAPRDPNAVSAGRASTTRPVCIGKSVGLKLIGLAEHKMT